MGDPLPEPAPSSALKLREVEARRIPCCPPNRSVASEEPAPIDAYVAPQDGIGDGQLPERTEEASGLHIESRIDIGKLSTAAFDHRPSVAPCLPVSLADPSSGRLAFVAGRSWNVGLFGEQPQVVQAPSAHHR